jgi:hypothetical protein
MSASLATVTVETTSLDRLTTAAPSAADLRYRAQFWSAYVNREWDTLTADQIGRIASNCADMVRQAESMEAPAATVVSLATVRKARTATVKTTIVPKMPTADDYWTMHSAAVQIMVNRHGLNWKVIGHADTVEVRLPVKLCSMTGPLGGKIRWNRDQRIPSPRFWPNGQLPTGVEVNGPGKPREEWATNGIEERTAAAVTDQAQANIAWNKANAERLVAEKAEREEARLAAEASDRIALGRSIVIDHWMRQHDYALSGYDTLGYKARSLAGLLLAAERRRAMAAELIAWRDHAERIEAEARELATSDLEF